MSKKGFISLSLSLGFICLVIILIFINKPNEEDFAKWFEEHFNVQCEDVKCYTLKLNNSGDSVENRFSYTDGYFDNSTGFLALGMQTKRLYRSIHDRNLFFSIEVKGFFGNFEVIDFSPKKVDITKK